MGDRLLHLTLSLVVPVIELFPLFSISICFIAFLPPGLLFMYTVLLELEETHHTVPRIAKAAEAPKSKDG